MKSAAGSPSLPLLGGIALALLFVGPALAHPVNTSAGEFYAGMMHPVTGLDHLLPALALALLASQGGKKVARATILAFPLSVLAGTIAGSRLPTIGWLQPASVLMLMVLGGLIALASYLPRGTVLAMAVLNGLILGYRSGNDMVFSRVSPRFIPGVVLTAFILLAMVTAWVPVAASRLARTARGLLGGGFILAGVALLGLAIAGPGLQSIRAARLPGPEGIMAAVKAEQLSVMLVLGALLASLVWGAGHALTPGHGKAIVAAYLIGSRSTPWHALFLGLTVTLTHTLGVFALGLIALFASQYVLPETLYPWLGTASGLVVVGLGAGILLGRVRQILPREVALDEHSHSHDHSHGHSHGRSHDHMHDHVHGHGGHQAARHAVRPAGVPDSARDHVGLHQPDHDPVHEDHGHDHAHAPDHEHGHNDHAGHDHGDGHVHSHLPPGADGAPVTWKSLLGLGISGGLLPCPAALVLLLAAVSLNRAAFGIALVVAFSLGLAGVLTAVGLLFVKSGRLAARVPRMAVAFRFLPIVSAVLILVIGIWLTVEAALQIRL